MKIQRLFVAGIFLLSIVPLWAVDDSQEIDLSDIEEHIKSFQNRKPSLQEQEQLGMLIAKKQKIVLEKLDEVMRPLLDGSKLKQNHPEIKKLFDVAMSLYGDEVQIYIALTDHIHDPKIKKKYYQMTNDIIQTKLMMAVKESSMQMRMLDEVYGQNNK